MLRDQDPERLRLTLSSILESASDGIFVIDRDERVVIFNHACERLTGLDRETVLGSRLRCDDVFRCHRFVQREGGGEEAVPGRKGARSLPVVHEEQACALLDIFGAHKLGAREETVLVSRTGQRHWVETVFSPVYDESGEAVYTVGVLRVIDERKRAEAEIRAKNEELERALAELVERTRQLVRSEKMASIGQLAAGVAHELNTPLNTILGYSQLLRDQLAKVDFENARAARERIADVMEELTAVQAATRRCRDIVQSLLDFSRPAEGVRLERNLSEVVRRVFGFLRHDFERRGIAVETDLSPDAWVLADRNQLEQVIMNLAKNAIDAMPEGGRIEVVVCKEQDAVRQEGAYGTGSELVHMRFADTGSGVPESVRSRIFEPFFTTKPVGSGTGLGLSISARIIEEHGGRLELDEDQTGGAVFHVWLPAADVEREGA